jgi:hypothetical protein
MNGEMMNSHSMMEEKIRDLQNNLIDALTERDRLLDDSESFFYDRD